MKSLLKKIITLILPSWLKEKIVSKYKLFSNYHYDYCRFARWTTINKNTLTKTQMRAVLTRGYHCIEKALSLSNPRIPFGIELSKRLLRHLKDYISKFGLDEVSQVTLNTLFEYNRFHHEHGHPDGHLFNQLNRIKKISKSEASYCALGGYMEVSKDEIWKISRIDLKGFFASRYSVRHFTPDNVEVSLINSAVSMARKTPSVCNRQSSRVHLYENPKKFIEILKYQNGNAGFSEQINKLIIVTSDLQNFLNTGERNQCWIDGGMFAMSLIYALHSLGLGSCCLNWSVELGLDMDIRKVANIPESESIIMLIAVGHLPSKFKVAQSARKELSEVICVH